MKDGNIVIKYKFEQKEIPIPKTFIELKYYKKKLKKYVIWMSQLF